jgi:hypothetical protein
MPENVPRRLMRFYRKNESPPQENNRRQIEDDNYNPGVAPNGRELLSEIPTMDYEDVEKNKKNLEEINSIEQKNLEEKLALKEVENFKNTHNRLPTGEESNQIAESLYNQLKNVDTNSLYPEMQGQAQNAGQSTGRRGRDRNIQKPAGQASIQTPAVSANVTDVKSLLEDDDKPIPAKKSGDDFDLGLDEGMDENTVTSGGSGEDIEDINIGELGNCPNCKKETDNVIYCPKCGFAFCSNCAKKEDGQNKCPKCGTKVKI